MAGSRLPAVNDPLCENTAIQKVNPHILCSPLFGAFGPPSTAVSYNTAWKVKHKLMQVMKERDDTRPLGGLGAAR